MDALSDSAKCDRAGEAERQRDGHGNRVPLGCTRVYKYDGKRAYTPTPRSVARTVESIR